MARVLLVYDVVDDRKRGKVADACKDYGLDRFQFSAFTGELSRNHQEELMLKVTALLDGCEANVQLIAIEAAEWRKRLEVVNA